jgi:Tfp pilus assembly PilM family ATPase
VDIGRHSLKSIRLQKKGGGRLALTHFASHVINPEIPWTVEELGRQLKALLKNMGGSASGCVVSVNSPDALVRIIDQPNTEPEMLRDALRLNGLALLNQDCREFVLDCDFIPTATETATPAGQKRYLVVGLPRNEVTQLGEALDKGITSGVSALQLCPVSIFNAFEFAQPEAFNEQPFFLLDIGHLSSTMMIGVKGELVLIRNIDFGGRVLLEGLSSMSGESPEGVLQALAQDDELMVENTRMALMALAREVGSSIGFFEGRREETISKVWVSGGLAKCASILQILGEELRMPCTSWNALQRCELMMPSNKQAEFADSMLNFSVACGAAVQLMKA